MGKKYDIERGLISKLLETKDIATIKDMQIKPFFFSGDNKKAFKFINETYLKTGEIPTIRVFTNKFKDYDLDTYVNDQNEQCVGTEESLRHWGNEIRQKVKHNKIVEATGEIVDKLDDLNTEEAYDLMKKTVLYIESDIVETSAVDITKDTDDRKRAYLERKEKQGMIGIPTGFDKLDFILKGLQDKQLITLIAKTGVGKTWIECIIGANAQLNNYRVLHFTTEMAEEQLRDRYEAILIGLTMGEFNYGKFKSGMLPKEEEEKYFNFLDNVAPKLEPLIIETASGVSNVSAKIDQYNPDLILIDGAYLMEDERGAKDDWLRVAHITRDLKAIAKSRKKPIFINSQADSTTSKKTGPELENIGFSKAIGHDSDVVLSLFQDEIMREDREMKLKVLKQREGVLGSVMLSWDFTTMNFQAIYSKTEEDMSNGDSDKAVGVLDI